MSEEEFDAYVDQHFHTRPASYLPLFGYQRGVPDIFAMRVVSQHDDTKMVDAREFLAMSPEEREEFMSAAPRTKDNELERSSEVFADAIARAMSKLQGNGRRRRRQSSNDDE